VEILGGRASTVIEAEENEDEDEECDQRGADADSGFGARGEAVVRLGYGDRDGTLVWKYWSLVLWMKRMRVMVRMGRLVMWGLRKERARGMRMRGVMGMSLIV